MLEGLTLARAKGYNLVNLELDFSPVVHSLQGEAVGSAQGRGMVKRIKRLLAEDWTVRVTHVYREAHTVADGLVRMGCGLVYRLVTMHHPPPQVSQLLLADVVGVVTPRLIPL